MPRVFQRLRRIMGAGRPDAVEMVRDRLAHFRELVQKNDRALTLIAEAGEKLGGEYVFDRQYLRSVAKELREHTHGVVAELAAITGDRYPELTAVLATIDRRVQAATDLRMVVPDAPMTLPLEAVRLEHEEIVGDKMARLGEVGSRLGMSVPSGFVVSTRACWEFLQAAGVAQDVESLSDLRGDDHPDLTSFAGDIRRRIIDARVPHPLSRAIRKEVSRLQGDGSSGRLAIRSSAAGEDGDLITAGQYRTVLGVIPDEVCVAYKQVVASLFGPEALAYHLHHGVAPGRGMMAVGCLSMVPARSSGVAYSLDPLRPDRDVQLVAASWGLGKIVVDGVDPVDRFEVQRSPGHPVLTRKVARKERKYVLGASGGIVEERVTEDEGQLPALTDDQLSQVAEAACRIERYMKSAQDVEWALDAAGRLWVLQARPLKLQAAAPSQDEDLQETKARYRVLMQGLGEIVCRGIASGLVRIVDGSTPLPEQPARDRVLVARTAAPWLGAHLSEACAVITDVGNVTGHFAAVAREARLPTIVGTGVGSSTLREGQEVTVDAEDNIVYLGRVEELLHYQLMRSSSFEDTPEFRALRRMLRWIAPLNLSDPQNSEFSPSNCSSYHDVIRFAHEKAAAALTDMEWISPSAKGQYVRRVDLSVPLDLILVDLGGGAAQQAPGKKVALSDIQSKPLRPLLEALCEEGAWETAPADMDLNGFMSSATRSASLASPLTSRPEQNLAIASGEYLHLSLRLGYHFNVVDSFLTDSSNDNYIYFRFVGGVTELARRSRRANLLKRILEANGFVVEGRGDLVIGRTRGLQAEEMVERMSMIGKLIGFTRQLDIFLRDDDRVHEYVERFLNGQQVRPDN